MSVIPGEGNETYQVLDRCSAKISHLEYPKVFGPWSWYFPKPKREHVGSNHGKNLFGYSVFFRILRSDNSMFVPSNICFVKIMKQSCEYARIMIGSYPFCYSLTEPCGMNKVLKSGEEHVLSVVLHFFKCLILNDGGDYLETFCIKNSGLHRVILRVLSIAIVEDFPRNEEPPQNLWVRQAVS
jgi:hypothetical protein